MDSGFLGEVDISLTDIESGASLQSMFKRKWLAMFTFVEMNCAVRRSVAGCLGLVTQRHQPITRKIKQQKK